MVDAGVIQPGSSEKMGPAAVGALGGAIAWFVSVVVCMIVFRNDGAPSREEAIVQRLIWLDVGLAASTCLVVAQRRLRPPGSIVLMSVVGFMFLAVALRQFLPLLAECAPMAAGGCREGF